MTWVALGIWPFVAAAFFSSLRLPIALLATIIGGYLLLPPDTSFDLPVLPPFNKHTVPAFAAMLFVLIRTRPKGYGAAPEWQTLPGILPRDRVTLALFLMLFVGHIGTHMLNNDPVFYGERMLPALRPYDAFSAMLATFLQFIPFLLARKVLSSNEGQRLTLIALAVAGAAYTFPALYEVRMSPQLNQMVYGFFPHDWSQHRRSWGWRPIVFVEHGLRLSIFFAIAVLSAAVMTSLEEGKSRTLWLLMTLWLLFVLIMSKSLGALLITLVILGAIVFLPRRGKILFVFGVTVAILLYPVIRAADILPYEQLLSNVSAERARSMNTRLSFEQLLLEKANERPLFGWGGWGRSRIYAEDGTDFTIVDGTWIIWLGLGGWLKYISVFGLLSWGILRLFWRRGQEVDKVSVGLALVLTANLVDLIPNSGLTPVTWLLAGALCGRLEYKTAPQTPHAQPVSTAEPANRKGPVYARQFQERTRKQPKEDRKKALPYRRSFSRDRS